MRLHVRLLERTKSASFIRALVFKLLSLWVVDDQVPFECIVTFEHLSAHRAVGFVVGWVARFEKLERRSGG